MPRKSESLIILAIDCDKTICDSSEVDHLLPKVTGDIAHAEWINAVRERDFPPIPEAERTIRALMNCFDVVPVILTARTETLFPETRAWINRYFPTLREAELSMRAPTSVLPSHVDKINRLRTIRKLRPTRSVYVYDDDPKMIDACEEQSDRFILAGVQHFEQPKKKAFK